MTGAYSGFGAQLQRGDGGAPETFSTIAEVKDIPGPKMKAATLEATSHDSANGFAEFIMGIRDGGEFDVDVNWLPGNATHAAALSDFNVGRVGNWKIVLPSAVSKTWSFTAGVAGFEAKAPVNGIMSATLKFRVSGKPTLA